MIRPKTRQRLESVSSSNDGFQWRKSLFPHLAALYIMLFGAAAIIVWRTQPDLPQRLLGLQPYVLLLFATFVAVTLACAGQVFVHHHFRSQEFVRHNEVGGFIIAVAGTLFSVVLGFMTVVAWQHFSEARQLVSTESASATDAWHMAVGLPPEERNRVRRDVLAYASVIIGSEWPRMQEGTFDTRGDLILMDAIGSAGTFKSKDFSESNAQGATLQQLGLLHDERQQRLSANAGGISGFEWCVLFVGAVCIVCFCWLFGLSNPIVHLLMTSTVTVIVASTLVLLLELQYPFRSGVRIPPDSWVSVITHIHVMQTGSQMNMRM